MGRRKTKIKILSNLLLPLFLFTGLNLYHKNFNQKEKNSNIRLLTPGDNVTDSCTWNGIPLYGKVKFVESFPDIKVKFVQSFPDLKVKFVESFPDKCGEWQVVESFPDFTVKVVESFPDITIKTVNSFPGKP